MPLLDRYKHTGVAVPDNAVSVDLSRRTAAGLIHAWPFFALDIKDKLFDWVNGRVASMPSPTTISKVETPFGSCWRNDDQDPGINLGTDAMNIDEDFSFALWCVVEDIGTQFNDGIAFSKMDDDTSGNQCDDTNADFRFNWNDITDFQWHINASGSSSNNQEGIDATGKFADYNRGGGGTGAYVLQHLMLTRLGGTGYMYLNGNLLHSSDGISGSLTQTGTRRFGIVDPWSTGGRRSWLSIFDFRVYNKGMRPAEAWRLYDPQTRWELYRVKKLFLTIGLPEIARISPSGIASAESFGTPSLAMGNVDIAPTGIPSEQAVGSPSISVGNVDVVPVAIPSEESFGTAVLSTGNVDVAPTGIATQEAFGSPVVSTGNVDIAPIGIASAEALGIPIVSPVVNIAPTGIGSAESFGAAVVTPGNVNVAPTGIPSAEAIGTPGLSVVIGVSGIASAEAFGSPTVLPGTVFISPTGIPSGEAFGSPTVLPGTVFISPTGIPSGEAFGSPSTFTEQFLSPSGIPTAEAIGSPTIILGGPVISPIGIPSAEAFGIAHFTITFSLPSIASEEVFETPTVTVIARNSFQQMMETDLDEGFFDCNEFAEPITIFYKDGSSLATCGIFDHEYTTVDPEATAEMQSRDPMVMIQTSDLTKQNFEIDYIVIRGVQYKAIVPEPDGTGVTDIILHHR